VTGDRWYYGDEGVRKGPLTLAELGALLEAGRIDDWTPIWVEGGDGWMMPRQASDVRARLGALEAAPTTVAPPPAAAGKPHVAFGPIFKTTQSVCGSLVLIGVLVRTGRNFMAEIPRDGAAVAGMKFFLAFTITGFFAVIVNVIVVCLPLAGIIYFFRNLADRPPTPRA
jgi:hypothetical protein